jgi:aspartate aminotransferase-like enzyme
VTHNETSTGVLNDLPALAAAVHAHSDALLLVDAVSSAGAAPVRMDEWGVDAVITASQKALMAPPGLALLALSERASAAARVNERPRHFFDVARMEAEVAAGSTSYTPAIPVVFALRAALDLIEAEGLDAVYERHRRIASTVREGAAALGLDGLADAAHGSPALTALLTPDGTSATELRRRLEREHAVYVNQGRGPLKDRLLRVGHMGNVSDADARQTLDALAEVLR